MQDLNKSINFRELARNISLVENESTGYEAILKGLSFSNTAPIIGITGPPGAGKSTLLNAMLAVFNQQQKNIAVIAVDPTSPFNYGALLGDRIRMAQFFNYPNIYIRSLATRGSLGGLSEKIIEITDLVRSYPFDYVFVETVGVGQSEVEIAGLADTSIVVLVPESGDEVQTMKAGLMEIADIFVVNKSDREAADKFAANLIKLCHSRDSLFETSVIKTIASKSEGIEEVILNIQKHLSGNFKNEKKPFLLAKKAHKIIQKKRMRDIDQKILLDEIKKSYLNKHFNVYAFTEQFLKSKS